MAMQEREAWWQAYLAALTGAASAPSGVVDISRTAASLADHAVLNLGVYDAEVEMDRELEDERSRERVKAAP